LESVLVSLHPLRRLNDVARQTVDASAIKLFFIRRVCVSMGHLKFQGGRPIWRADPNPVEASPGVAGGEDLVRLVVGERDSQLSQLFVRRLLFL